MGRDKPQPLSRERFENNADRLIFPDRHEYRTRSRVGKIAWGIFFFVLGDGLCVGMPLYIFFKLLPDIPEPFASSALTITIVGSAIFLPLSLLFVWFSYFFVSFNPTMIVSPLGLDFKNLPFTKRLSFRHRSFRVGFDEILSVELFVRGEAGLKGNRATTFHHGVLIYTEKEKELKLPWTAYEKEAAQKFMEAFAESCQTMVDRNQAGPFR